MIEIFEIETFETPEGTYEIIPLPTEDIDLLLEFIDIQSKQGTPPKMPKKGKTPIADTKSITFALKELTPIADKIVDKGTQKQDTTPSTPLPMKYRNIQNRIELCMAIIKVTMGTPEEGVDAPLPVTPAPM
jgi:hypothetical protein